jgi:hypothetical protein
MNFLTDVINLYVFDANNNKIAELNSLQKGDLVVNKNEDGYLLKIIDSSFNLQLAKFISQYKVNEYEELLKGNDDMVLEFGNFVELDCKLIATNYLIDGVGNRTKGIIYEMPVCTVSNDLQIETFSQTQVSPFNYIFKVYPYSDNGNCFKLHIKNK